MRYCYIQCFMYKNKQICSLYYEICGHLLFILMLLSDITCCLISCTIFFFHVAFKCRIISCLLCSFEFTCSPWKLSTTKEINFLTIPWPSYIYIKQCFLCKSVIIMCNFLLNSGLIAKVFFKLLCQKNPKSNVGAQRQSISRWQRFPGV